MYVKGLIYFLFCTLICPLVNARGESITLGYSDVETYPFQMGEGLEPNNPPGLAVALIRHVASGMSLDVRFTRMPNKRVLKSLQSGSIDGAFVFSYKPTRAQYAVYPMLEQQLDPTLRLTRLSYYLYVMKDSQVQWDGRDLTGANLKVAANSGYSVVKDLRALGVDVYEAKSSLQNFKRLQLGRVSAVAAQGLTAAPSLSVLKDANIKRLQPALSTKDYYLIYGQAFYRKSPQLANQLWRELARHRDDFYQRHMSAYVDTQIGE